jgi:thioredoxin type arsenate reductase
MPQTAKLNILFLCTGNSCRSQMAEGWCRHLKGDVIEPFSAGIETHGLNPNAVNVMAEAGIDISCYRSKHLLELKNIHFDYVITVCDNAHESCPIFPGKTKVIHVGFDDPPRLAKAAKTEQEALDCYRRVRDEIRAFIETLPESLKTNERRERSVIMAEASNKNIRETVRKGYKDIAQGKSNCCCGSSSHDKLAEAVGYTNEELESLPDGANMGLSCGNPTAIANLKPGQVVLDLGSGGGFDVFIAARKVGPQGKAIGVDMTPEMLSRARAGISTFTEKTGLSNIEFRLGEIEHLPIADNSVDVVISNCVINLSPDKPQVWNEIARVLKPGGKACISDLALKKPLPKNLLDSAAARVSCVAGAVLIEETIQLAKQAGLYDIQIDEKAYSIDVLADCNDPLYKEVKESLPQGTKLSDYIVSINITAFKKHKHIQ